MKMMCINKNGWFFCEGSYYANSDPGNIDEFPEMEYQKCVDIDGSLISKSGCMVYVIDENEFQSDQFIPLEHNEEEMIYEEENEMVHEI